MDLCTDNDNPLSWGYNDTHGKCPILAKTALNPSRLLCWSFHHVAVTEPLGEQ